MSAPPPAPPPASAAVRLPLPVLVSDGAVVSTVYVSFFTEMFVRVSERTAPPLKRPAGLASFTTPEACAPLGIARRPSIEIGAETVAPKADPGVLIFEPTG